MGVWSTGDPALTEIQMTGSAENVAGPWRYERLDGPGHWMQLDAPNRSTRYCWISCGYRRSKRETALLSTPGYTLGPTPEEAQLWSRFLMTSTLCCSP